MSASIIEVTHLSKTFGESKAVDDISFSVSEGDVYAFLGPNGAGKSTTIKMLTTLLRPTTGSICVAGIDVLKNPSDARRLFSVMFQEPSLDDELTAYENLEFHGILYGVPKVLRHKRIDDLLEMVELSGRRNHLVKEFSGGMKRRLEIARGLLHHPRILFLDEPTVGLDPQTRRNLWEYVHTLNKTESITVFFTTHYLDEVDQNAHTISIIDHGVIVADGTVDSIKKKTNTSTMEDAFLALTGKAIREEGSDASNNSRIMRAFAK